MRANGQPSGNDVHGLLAGARNSRWFRLGTVLAIVALVAAVAVIFASCGDGGEANESNQPTDEQLIDELANNFAAAVEAADQTSIIGLLCAEEAAGITDDNDYDPANDGGIVLSPNQTTTVTTSDVLIAGDVASALVTFPDDSTTTLYFRRENANWLVCAPAADQLTASTSVRPS